MIQEKRAQDLRNLSKWDDFRAQRVQAIDRFIQVKKKNLFFQQVAQQAKLAKVLRVLFQNYLEQKRLYKVY